MLQQRDTNQHPTFSHSASKMSSATPANFQSNHSTPSQGHLITDMSYSSSPGDSPILNSKFTSTPIPESNHQAQEEWERPHPPTPQQRLSDSAYYSDQSVQPESVLHRDEVEPLNACGMKSCYKCGTNIPVPEAKYCCECGTKIPSPFCSECGTKFPVPQAKFCCECGTKRM